ncbi:hypothetical protein SAMN05216474_3036 [Lishizhenia tianjinensis]|uniref:Uncharacterized protein n=1 Tax=Lishizhenia tianjinensis TaxID=477690 RepID=A0A1I7BRU7_9FLAO|nr:hypothetical protein [Lishizhenia tianjinensis]SFT89924.1 hypothetical protein SAMN05216474_3036 [Lishizhenia tianjinensis]
MKRLQVLGVVAYLGFVLIRLFFGVYTHDEFGEKHLFIKHRPHWKWSFYSPIGMSDKKLENLDEERKYEQLMFNEFVREQGLSR